MKDIIFRIIKLLFGLGLVAYAGYLIAMKAVVVQESMLSNNMTVLIIVILIGLFLLAMGVKSFVIPRPKLVPFLAGIIIILFANYSMVDSPENMIFIADILKILGVILVITGPMGIFYPKKLAEEIQESKVEIIEV